LYHADVITFSHIIEALLWQRRQRERFCEVSRRWGLLLAGEADQLLASRMPGEPVGAAAERLGLLSRAEVQAVLCFQRRRQRPLGEYFVERGLFSASSLDVFLAHLKIHNASLARHR
jgi:hypothetical protein